MNPKTKVEKAVSVAVAGACIAAGILSKKIEAMRARRTAANSDVAAVSAWISNPTDDGGSYAGYDGPMRFAGVCLDNGVTAEMKAFPGIEFIVVKNRLDVRAEISSSDDGIVETVFHNGRATSKFAPEHRGMFDEFGALLR